MDLLMLSLREVKMPRKNHDHEEETMVHAAPSKYWESYVKLASGRVIFLSEDFSKEAASATAALLLYYDNQDQTEDITIYINSDGGDVSALNCIYDVIQLIKAPVKTVCIGKCYSAGAVLLAAGAKGKRYIMRNAEVMIHKIQVGFPIINKTQIDHESYLTFLNMVNNNLMKMLSKHTGQPIAKIKADFSSRRDIYMDAKQAIAYGLADHIV